MPMLDAYIPTDALTPDAEQQLLADLTDVLLTNEGADPSNPRVRSIAWLFVHRPQQVYVAGAPASACPQGSPGGARHPRKGGRIAETAPNGSKRVRWFAADFRHRPGG